MHIKLKGNDEIRDSSLVVTEYKESLGRFLISDRNDV